MENAIKKCIFILPYFGKFNNYFDLFLRSCACNPSFDWLIFTDCKDKYSFPSNVHVQYMAFPDIKEIAEKKLSFDIRLNSPYKLCDYKPAYGFLFEKYILDYEYWGHCDCDLIFGNLEKMLLPLLECGYDKLFAAGHLTIYKNTKENNRKFMSLYRGKEIYREAFSTEDIYVFDEDYMHDHNVHSIFLESDANVYSMDLSMNTSTTSGKLVRELYDPQIRKWRKESWIPSRYYWSNGDIISISLGDNGKSIIKKEYLYIHLQMRKMRANINKLKLNCFEILPDRFRPVSHIPKNRKEMCMWNIDFTYLYWTDVYIKKFKRKIKRKAKNV